MCLTFYHPASGPNVHWWFSVLDAHSRCGSSQSSQFCVVFSSLGSLWCHRSCSNSSDQWEESLLKAAGTILPFKGVKYQHTTNRHHQQGVQQRRQSPVNIMQTGLLDRFTAQASVFASHLYINVRIEILSVSSFHMLNCGKPNLS